jgi:hypothetical protein
LKDLGVSVVNSVKQADGALEIRLEAFRLDLVGRKWTVDLRYEAVLRHGEDRMATETVRVQAERLKVVGRSQADQVMGESFTDAVNQLNVPSLFRRAGL